MGVMSFANYARHRGCSRAAVTNAVKEGRIFAVTDELGNRLIDSDSADQAWRLNTRHDKRVNGLGQPPPSQHQDETEKPSSKSSQAIPSIASSRAIKEAYQARLAKVLYEEKIKKLLDSDKVAMEAFELGRLIRESVLNIPSRISSELANETDPVKIHAILTRELTQSLEELYNAGRRNKSI